MNSNKQMGPFPAMCMWLGIYAFFLLLVFTSQKGKGQIVNPPTGIDLNMAIAVCLTVICLSVFGVWLEASRKYNKSAT